ncbi:MAG: cytochrome c oxidase assembly protein [Gammaproteobacteria bacterium]|nr:cytochrome c oxidase assembly protein [Gammaproteobacteria bacterium]
MSANAPATANRRTAIKLALTAVGMFAFGYVLSSFYDQICRAVGIGGKTGRIEQQAVGPVDSRRTITIEFTGNVTDGLPWEFRPLVKRIEAHPGETLTVRYYVRNTTNETITGQAIPSVAPARAGPHFKKIECFCFTRQTLKAGEVREMPVRFVVQPALANDVNTITLSYAFFNVDKKSATKYGGSAAPEQGHSHDDHVSAGDNG